VTLLFMIGIFVVGDNIVSGSSEHVAAERPVTEAPAPAPVTQTIQEPEVTEQPAEVPEYSYTQPVETSFDHKELNTVKTKPATAPAAPEKTVTDSTAKVSPPKPSVTAPSAKTKTADKPVIGTTVVITAKNGKVSSRIEVQKPVDKKPAANADKAVITRPRIVANPRQ